MAQANQVPDEAEAGDTAGKAPIAILHKKKLIEAVVAASGVKKKTVRPVVEAVLAEIGAALSRGDALNLPPMGKVAVNRTKEARGSEVLILKMRRAKPGAPGEAAAPEAGADDDDSDE